MALIGLSIPPLESWMPVPLDFPYGSFATPTEWSRAVAESGVGVHDRKAMASALLELQSTPPPLEGAQARFLWTMDVQHPLLVHVYAVEIVDDLADLAGFATSGIGGFVQSMSTVEAEGYRVAASALLIGSHDEETTFIGVRWLGQQNGALVVVDLITQEAGAFALAAGDVEALFRGIRVVAE